VSRSTSNRLLAGFILVIYSSTVGQASPVSRSSNSGMDSAKDGALRISVRLHDYARVQCRILSQATSETATIFQDLGVEVLWIECPLSSQELRGSPACRQPLGSAGFDLNIVPHAVAALPAFPRTTLGFTPMSREGERVSLSDVFYDRVKEQTEIVHGSLGRVLGDVMAHEIGHLLLRTSLYSSTGIMHAQWTVEDLSRAARGQLRFTRLQSELIRAEMLARRQEEDKTTSQSAGKRSIVAVSAVGF
jgi:hypothetical protein